MENALIILFGLTMLYMAATSRMIAHIRILCLQGILLFLICYFGIEEQSKLGFLFLAFETLIVKAMVIPMFLDKIVKTTHEYRDAEANIPHFYCLFISTIILFTGFLVSDFNFPAIRMINAKELIAKMNSKTCDILNLAIADSTVAKTKEIIAITARNTKAVQPNPIDETKLDGIIKLAIKASNITILIPAAQVITARS